MTIQEIQQKLYKNLKESGWGDRLKMFLLSDEFTTILTALHNEASAGKRFTPILKEIFRAFTECPYNDLKVIIIGPEPYPIVGQADGIAFSAANVEKEPDFLDQIFDEIERTVYKPGLIGKEAEVLRGNYNPDLKRWSNQGILMLNMALTTQIGDAGKHFEIWRPFMENLLDMLNTNNTGLVYVFIGDKVRGEHKAISTQNYKLFTSHPGTAFYTSTKAWNSGNLFNQINKILKAQYGEQILW